MNGIIGTGIYCSPEVVDNLDDEKCDEWPCWVLTYILLGGIPQFSGETEEEIFQKIKNMNMISLRLLSKKLGKIVNI